MSERRRTISYNMTMSRDSHVRLATGGVREFEGILEGFETIAIVKLG